MLIFGGKKPFRRLSYTDVVHVALHNFYFHFFRNTHEFLYYRRKNASLSRQSFNSKLFIQNIVFFNTIQLQKLNITFVSSAPTKPCRSFQYGREECHSRFLPEGDFSREDERRTKGLIHVRPG